MFTKGVFTIVCNPGKVGPQQWKNLNAGAGDLKRTTRAGMP